MAHPAALLKTVCNQHGIHSLASLCCFMLLKSGRSMARIGELSGQSTTSVGEWILIYELHGLIVRGESPRNRVRPLQFTPAGQHLRNEVNTLLGRLDKVIPIETPHAE